MDSKKIKGDIKKEIVMNAVVRWLFERTKLFGWLNGHKTNIGFALVLFSWLLGALSGLSDVVAEFFPSFEGIAKVHGNLSSLYSSLGELLEQVGLGGMLVGLGHDKLKRT